MDDGYDTALLRIAEAYEEAVGAAGGRSLSTVATIVASSGGFFSRLREGKPFQVSNLEKFARWFREPVNWPNHVIPANAVVALQSIGRSPCTLSTTDTYVTSTCVVASNRPAILDNGAV